MSSTHVVFEGNGDEVSRYAKAHPKKRFKLISDDHSPRKPFDRKTWDEVLAHIESFRGKMPVLPDSAFSTDSLYD